MTDDCARLIAVLEGNALGRVHAIPARRLHRDYGFDDRTLRALAHTATERGHLVCADNAGYFVPSSKDEVDECVRRLRSQGQEMLARAAKIERLAEHQFGDRLF